MAVTEVIAADAMVVKNIIRLFAFVKSRRPFDFLREVWRRNMIDIHTHILPEMDDGSSGIEETKKMFEMLMEQGVDTVVATPHMYLDENGIDEFLERRKVSAEKLFNGIAPADRLPVALGAEVQFCPELYAMDDVEKLCISGTKYLLVELPFFAWSAYTYKVLSMLYSARGIIPIVAHVERYLEFQEEDEVDVIRKLKESNALIQINSSFLTDKTTRRKALGMVKKGLINFMGSDCHNTETRLPDFIRGFDVIYDKLGEDGLAAFEYWEDKIKDKIAVY